MQMEPLTEADTIDFSMEALDLPVHWCSKMEPISPPSSELFPSIESPSLSIWRYEDNLAYVDEIKLTHLEELLDEDDDVHHHNLVKLSKEPWTDGPLPLAIEYPIDTTFLCPHLKTKVQNPFDIADLNAADSTELIQFTPPHSPPLVSNNVTAEYFSIKSELALMLINTDVDSETPEALTPVSVNNIPHPSATSSPLQNFSFPNWNGNNTLVAFGDLNDDIARDTRIVDEIVNTRAKELPDWNDECESLSSSYSGPSQSESINDEEWLPSSSYSSDGSSPVRSLNDEPNTITQHANANSSTTSRKRSRGYIRGVEDRKMRKKEQNKNAATRYRQKKKLEMEHVLSEEQQLTQRNEELTRLLADRKREAKYLKTLIREFYQRKE